MKMGMHCVFSISCEAYSVSLSMKIVMPVEVETISYRLTGSHGPMAPNFGSLRVVLQAGYLWLIVPRHKNLHASAATCFRSNRVWVAKPDMAHLGGGIHLEAGFSHGCAVAPTLTLFPRRELVLRPLLPTNLVKEYQLPGYFLSFQSPKMAEVLGIVASGLSVAQIAGSIVTTSIKVKALLDEVKNAPDNLKDMLEYIELLAPILCEANTAGDEGAGTTNSLPLAATSHLRQALAKCQAASEQLELLARSLMSQMDAARGGVRRKCAMFKILLKRGTLSEYEKRLQKTIQLLSLAHDIYTL